MSTMNYGESIFFSVSFSSERCREARLFGRSGKSFIAGSVSRTTWTASPPPFSLCASRRIVVVKRAFTARRNGVSRVPIGAGVLIAVVRFPFPLPATFHHRIVKWTTGEIRV